jgi:hypothetical protein
MHRTTLPISYLHNIIKYTIITKSKSQKEENMEALDAHGEQGDDRGPASDFGVDKALHTPNRWVEFGTPRYDLNRTYLVDTRVEVPPRGTQDPED